MRLNELINKYISGFKWVDEPKQSHSEEDTVQQNQRIEVEPLHNEVSISWQSQEVMEPFDQVYQDLVTAREVNKLSPESIHAQEKGYGSKYNISNTLSNISILKNDAIQNLDLDVKKCEEFINNAKLDTELKEVILKEINKIYDLSINNMKISYGKSVLDISREIGTSPIGNPRPNYVEKIVSLNEQFNETGRIALTHICKRAKRAADLADANKLEEFSMEYPTLEGNSGVGQNYGYEKKIGEIGDKLGDMVQENTLGGLKRLSLAEEIRYAGVNTIVEARQGVIRKLVGNGKLDPTSIKEWKSQIDIDAKNGIMDIQDNCGNLTVKISNMKTSNTTEKAEDIQLYTLKLLSEQIFEDTKVVASTVEKLTVLNKDIQEKEKESKIEEGRNLSKYKVVEVRTR